MRGEAAYRGEIRNDAFAAAIEAVAANPRVRTILEIGSASGAGSTASFVRGIARNESRPRLFCLEAAPERFRELQDRYADAANVYCVNASSVGLEGVATEGEVSTFHTAIESTLNRYRLDDVLRWREADLGLIRSGRVPLCGIRAIRGTHGIEIFDAVLIDGSEFTARAELDEVAGTHFVLLDDVNSFKNHFNCQRLAADEEYELIESSRRVRNGYAVFARRP